MDSKFSIDDIVVYEEKLYKVLSVYLLNTQLKSSPYVYQLARLRTNETFKVLVREDLLERAVGWQVLYDK